MNYRDSSKYHSRRIKTYEGTFDSKKEYRRWVELKFMLRSGEITELQRQVSYTLVPSQQTSKKKERPVKYIADFVYKRDGKTIVEDTKGFRTPEYVIKRKLMLFIHGIEVQEI